MYLYGCLSLLSMRSYPFVPLCIWPMDIITTNNRQQQQQKQQQPASHYKSQSFQRRISSGNQNKIVSTLWFYYYSYFGFLGMARVNEQSVTMIFHPFFHMIDLQAQLLGSFLFYIAAIYSYDHLRFTSDL